MLTTSSYIIIPNAVFIDLPGSSLLGSILSGTLTITPNIPVTSGAFSNFDTPGAPSDPAAGDGFMASTHGNWVVGALTLDFSNPVAAFGVTFVHFPSSLLPTWGMNLPASLTAFDGPNGSGNLLGSVTSSGWLGGVATTFDFVGLLSDSLNIRSVLISGASDPKGYAVDGYAVSTTPVPEPAAVSQLWVGLASLAFLRRKGSRRSVW